MSSVPDYLVKRYKQTTVYVAIILQDFWHIAVGNKQFGISYIYHMVTKLMLICFSTFTFLNFLKSILVLTRILMLHC